MILFVFLSFTVGLLSTFPFSLLSLTLQSRNSPFHSPRKLVFFLHRYDLTGTFFQWRRLAALEESNRMRGDSLFMSQNSQERRRNKKKWRRCCFERLNSLWMREREFNDLLLIHSIFSLFWGVLTRYLSSFALHLYWKEKRMKSGRGDSRLIILNYWACPFPLYDIRCKQRLTERVSEPHSSPFRCHWTRAERWMDSPCLTSNQGK